MSDIFSVGNLLSLIDAIHLGESKVMEFKEVLPSTSAIAKTVIAFSNTGGGKIVIGVEDRSRRVVGVHESDLLDIPDRISDMISDAVSPSLIPEIYTERVEGKSVVVVQVYPGSLKPYHLKSKGRIEGTYIRVGASNRKADAEMLRELERQRLNLGFDEELATHLSMEDLNLERLKSDFKSLAGRELNEEAMQTLNLCCLQGGRLQVTHGGWLLAGRFQPEMANIQCARFKGDNVGSFIDQKQFFGPLYLQVQEAMAFAQTHIAMSGKIKGLQREDRYLFPLEAIREALVNAMIHRDYSISGSNIKLAIFDKRIEVTSPGALPKGMVISDLSSGRSEVRNKVLARFFKEIHFIEQWGTGIARMTQACLDHGLKPPKFQETGLFFKVIFAEKKKSSTNWKGQLLELLEDQPSITAEQCASMLNKSSRTIERQLAQYREAKVITRKGGTRGVWVVH